MKNKVWLIVGLLALVAVAATLMLAPAAAAGKLEDAIAKTPVGTGNGQINPDAPKGFIGIPGAPSHFWLFYILWGALVGWIFS